MGELVNLCNEAIRQRTLRIAPGATTFRAPISQQFVEDTIELMQPLYGWMVRRPVDGILRGFLLCTTFTTWVGPDKLRWVERRTHSKSRAGKGPPALAAQLNASTRYGAPLTTGVVWPRVAEISLVGALGCGTLLVRELLRRLKAGDIVSPCDNKPYKYVALQATKNAVSFYQRIGFVHVEAEARHFTSIVEGRVDPDAIGPWKPFRHFEYVVPDGLAPSHMMALRLDKLDTTAFTMPKWDVIGEGGPIDMFLRGGGKYGKRKRCPPWFGRHLKTVCSENARLAPKQFRSNGIAPSAAAGRIHLENGAAKDSNKRRLGRIDSGGSAESLKMVPRSIRICSKKKPSKKRPDQPMFECVKCGKYFYRRGLGPHRAHCKGPYVGNGTDRRAEQIGRVTLVTPPDATSSSSSLCKTDSVWDCSRCTLINLNGGATCEACGATRPGGVGKSGMSYQKRPARAGGA